MFIASAPDLNISITFQERVNYYTSELQIAKNHHVNQNKKTNRHLFEVQTYGEYDYHHNFFDGAVNRDKKFWDPEMVSSYTKKM